MSTWGLATKPAPRFAKVFGVNNAVKKPLNITLQGINRKGKVTLEKNKKNQGAITP